MEITYYVECDKNRRKRSSGNSEQRCLPIEDDTTDPTVPQDPTDKSHTLAG